MGRANRLTCRCRVHFLRNVLAQVPKGNAEWQTGDRRYLAEATMVLLAPPSPTAEQIAHPELIPA
jgi:hypothetical protein